MREDMTRAEMVEKCRRDRDKLTRKMMALYPEFEGQMPSAWIEDLIPSLCGFRVVPNQFNYRPDRCFPTFSVFS